MKIFVIDKYTIITFFLLSALVAIMLPIGFTPVYSVMNSKKELPIYAVSRDDKKIAITFDCAWSADDIPDIIKTLKEHNCPATFFVVGTWAKKYPDAVRALDIAGMEIANHSNNHLHMNNLGIEKIIEEMNDCDAIIQSLTGKKSPCFRAPYGEYNNNVINACTETGRYCIQWDIDSLDWKDLSFEKMNKRITKKVKSGSIILFHNGTKHTAASLGKILDNLTKEGYSFVKVSDLIYRDDFYIDENGLQIKKSPSPRS